MITTIMTKLVGILIVKGSQKVINGNDYKTFHTSDVTLLIKYNMKNLLKQFNKNFENLYVVVEQIDDKFGALVETLGSVEDPDAYIKYIYKKCIYKYSLNLKQNIQIDNESELAPENVEVLSDYILTIDPMGSTDLDDAFSINHNANYDILRIFIPRFEKNDISSLVNDIKVASTIYSGSLLPMIKKTLTNKYSLLNDNQIKSTICLELTIKDSFIIKENLCLYYVKISKNLAYDDDNEHVKALINIINKIDATIVDDHKAIEFLMIYFNKYIANLRLPIIYRNCVYNENHNENQNQNENRNEFIEYFASYNCKASLNKFFDSLYTHVTSPLRRLPDLLNNFIIQNYLNSDANHNNYSEEFIDSINKQIGIIKKSQHIYTLWNMFKNEPDKMYRGIVVDDKTVYLNDIHLFAESTGYASRLQNLLPGKHYNFKVYLFESKNSFKKKVRIKAEINEE